MQQLTKEKTELIARLKVDEAENLSNNEKLKDMNEEGKKMEESQEGVTRMLTKELDKHKKKMIKLVSQQ
jgi:predicted nuclease with TOPRIM domain